MTCRHQKLLNVIIVNGLHAFDSLAATVLAAEVIHTHTLDVAKLRHGDDRIRHRNKILHGDIILIVADGASSLIAILLSNDHDLFLDDSQQAFFIRQDCLQFCNALHQFLIFCLDLLTFQSGQRTQTHIHDSLSLNICQSEAFYQCFLSSCHISAASDDIDDLINVIKGDQQTFQDMSPLLSLVQIIFCPSGNNILLMKEVIPQHILQIQHPRLIIDQCQHNNTKGILQLRVLVQLIQYYVGVHITPKLNADTHSFTVGFVSEIRDSVNLLILYQFSNLLNETRLIYHIWKLRHHDTVLSILHGLDIRDSPNPDLAPSGAIRFFNPGRSEDHSSGWKIRSLHDLQ